MGTEKPVSPHPLVLNPLEIRKLHAMVQQSTKKMYMQREKSMTMNITDHISCNDASQNRFGRIHLPVASKCNIQCNYCCHKFDCLNDNRPAITSNVLSPQQALNYLEKAMILSPTIVEVAITGPGDPFANPDETIETLRLVRKKYPDMQLCLATNGLDLLSCIDELARLQVNHVTITINAIDPKIGAEIYAWVRYNKKMYRDVDAAKLLIRKQLESLNKLKEVGIASRVNSIIIPGINDIHVITVASKVAELGADILNCLPFYNTKEILFENLAEPSPEMVQEIQEATNRLLPHREESALYKTDALKLIREINTDARMPKLLNVASLPEIKGNYRPYIAVSSMEGLLINQHLGEAERFLIYGMNDTGKYMLIDARKAPQAGGGEQRWKELADTLKDCRTVLVSGVGNSPRKVLNEHGIEVLVLEGIIKEVVCGIFSGEDMKELMKRSQIHASNSSCNGTGKKCG